MLSPNAASSDNRDSLTEGGELMNASKNAQMDCLLMVSCTHYYRLLSPSRITLERPGAALAY